MDKILQLIKKEERRQQTTLMMIPSENYTYPEVRKAVGSVLMHKYSEGQPYKRYYQGNEYIDEIEIICKSRALDLFDLKSWEWEVNVQSLSGSPANLAIYNALLSPGDKILSLYLPDGGHLSHGWHLPSRKITLVSKIYNVDFYRVNSKTGYLDYKEIEKKALEFKPKMIVSGGTAYPREINHKKMASIAKAVGALYLADASHEAGLIAARANTSPFPFADVVMMTTHKTLRGPRGALIFWRKTLEGINQSVFPGLQGGPHNEIIAGIAITLEKARSIKFKKYAIQTVLNAYKLASELKKKKIKLITDGTDKHLLVIDLKPNKVNSWYVALALEKAGIVVNRNAIAADGISAQTIYYPSGIRLGTPALSARGMKEAEMVKIANWIAKVIKIVGEKSIPSDKEEREALLRNFERSISKNEEIKKIRIETKKLCDRFPIDLH